MLTVEVRGAREIAEVAAACRRLGDRTIVNNMAREIKSAVPPIRRGVKANALARLPKRGGLNVWASRTSVRASVRRAANSAGVSLVAGRKSARNRSDIRRMDRGRIRHPLFGDRAHWYPQEVSPRFVTDAYEDGVDEFRDACVVAVNKAVEEAFG